MFKYFLGKTDFCFNIDSNLKRTFVAFNFKVEKKNVSNNKN